MYPITLWSDIHDPKQVAEIRLALWVAVVQGFVYEYHKVIK